MTVNQMHASGTRTFGGGFLTMKLSIPRPRLVSAQLPREEELRREITCKCCGLEHAVFGFAIWCPDCGADVFLLHVAAECQAVTTALAAVAGRGSELGARVAANDLDNALEDTVSIFEASLKVTLRKYLEAPGKPEHEINELFDRSVRNGFQNIGRAEELFRALTGGELLRDLSPSDVARLKLIFEKRHPITHNRGIADDKFLARTGLHGWGREVVASAAEVREVLGIVTRVIESAYRGLFPDAVSHSQ